MVAGSGQLKAAVRNMMMLASNPRHPKGDPRRYLAFVKSGASKLAPTLELALRTESDTAPVRVEWCGESDLTENDLYAPPPRNSSKLDEAKDFLRDLLADGPVLSDEVKAAAERGGLSMKTVRRAADAVHVAYTRTSEVPSRVLWALPSPAEPRPTPDPLS